jgi:hypothetical protein
MEKQESVYAIHRDSPSECPCAPCANQNGADCRKGKQMNRTPLTLALVALLTLGSNASAALVAHYEFEGSTNDSAGGNHGTAVGNPTYPAGVFGQAIDLDGVGDYVNCGNRPAFNLRSQITVAAWVNIRMIAGQWIGIVTKGDSGWKLSTVADQSRFHFSVLGAPNPYCVYGNKAVSAGQWHHVCGTYDGTTVRLYVDGVLDGIAGYTGSISFNTTAVAIGENLERPGRPWNGLIDDVRVYNHALSPAEVAALANSAVPTEPGMAFTYQGRLLDDNTAADGLYDLQFRLFTAATGGAQKGNNVPRNNVDVVDGFFTVQLDFGPDVFNGEPRWLQICVRPAYSAGAFTILGPRQQITPAPYAIYAYKPDRGNGTPGGIGGGGTVNCIARFTAGDSIGNSVVYQSGSSIGIGTTNPAYRLDVEGGVQAKAYYAGDIFFQKDGRKLWRMFEDETGLHVEQLESGKVYSLVLREADEGRDIGAAANLDRAIRQLKAENAELKRRVEALEKMTTQGGSGPRPE